MAMFPALMNDTMFSDLFDDPFFEGWRNTDNTMRAAMPANMMTTDVRETDKGYDVDIDMPGFKKEDINLELNNGYLTVLQWRGFPRDCGGSARRSLMTERSERMSEEAPGNRNTDGGTYASGFGDVSRSYLSSLSACNILSFL